MIHGSAGSLFLTLAPLQELLSFKLTTRLLGPVQSCWNRICWREDWESQFLSSLGNTVLSLQWSHSKLRLWRHLLLASSAVWWWPCHTVGPGQVLMLSPMDYLSHGRLIGHLLYEVILSGCSLSWKGPWGQMWTPAWGNGGPEVQETLVTEGEGVGPLLRPWEPSLRRWLLRLYR